MKARMCGGELCFKPFHTRATLRFRSNYYPHLKMWKWWQGKSKSCPDVTQLLGPMCLAQRPPGSPAACLGSCAICSPVRHSRCHPCPAAPQRKPGSCVPLPPRPVLDSYGALWGTVG